MLLKPQIKDIKITSFYLGRIILGLGLVLIIPCLFAVLNQEINPALDFAISSAIALIAGFLLITFCKSKEELNWMQAMGMVSLSWIAAMFLGAIPLYLSGHWASYLNACFDAMSGFATCGLTLVEDLAHLSRAHNLWRHLMMFVGGQGIVIIALSLFVRSSSGAFKIYVGEAREEKVMPSVISTARFIWLVSLVYLILGTTTLASILTAEGFSLKSAIFHSSCIFMAAFDTGGFAPQSQNIAYYHSFAFEITCMVLMILGALNFKLHYALWSGNRREIIRNIETTTFFITVMCAFLLVVIGLTKEGTYPAGLMLFRKGFFQLISAHSGTGYMTIFAPQFIKEWPVFAILGIIAAMGLGGAVCSTTGGIKVLRLSIFLKTLGNEIKKIMLPRSSVVTDKLHHVKDMVLDERQVRMALLIFLMYLGLYGIGAVFASLYGFPFLASLFESVSAGANVGLSCGIINPSLPALLKIIYILQMWFGRLEFIAIFTLFGVLIAAVKGR
ncbi:MAG: TrkH family potassium uptake protein [Candidatus Omnitrophica bacterium]|nr:TrkH family potassium uptake protein [Candidatus Omnitrophota bacterium]